MKKKRKDPAKLAAKFYNKIIKLHHREFNYKNEKIMYKKWLNLLASKLRKDDVVLDLGCGNGRALKYLTDKGLQGIGIDVSDEMLALSRKYVPKAKFYKKDFTKINFRPNSFDAVISFFALNHISKKDFRKVIKLSKKFLKKDGLLVLGMVEGNDEGLFTGFYGKKLTLYGAGYKKKELVDILKSCGFRIIKTGREYFKGRYFKEYDLFIFAKVKK